MQFNNTSVPPMAIVREDCLIPNLPESTQRKIMVTSMIIQVVLVPLLGLWTTISNLVVVVAICKSTSIRKPSTLITCSQAFSDLITGITVFPLHERMRIILLMTGRVCYFSSSKIYPSLFQYFNWVSILGTLANLAVFSIDRFYAISKPLLYRSKLTVRKVKIFFTAFWLFILVLQITLYDIRVLHIVLITACLVIIVASQILVVKNFSKHSATVATSAEGQSARTIMQEKKVAMTIGMMITVVCICTLPLIIYLIIRVSTDIVMRELVGSWITIIFYSNSAVNPILYYWKNENVKRDVKKLLRM